jgi:antitoxin HigA-1
MIRSYGGKVTAAVAHGLFVKSLPRDVQKIALRKLRQINAAASLDDLRIPPGNRLERLAGDRAGQYSVRINAQWRICFRWMGAMPMKSRSWITTEAGEMTLHEEFVDVATGERLPNVHPGEILREDFLVPMGLTKNALATAIGVPATRIGEIVRGRRSVSADTDLRLSRFLGTSEGFWLRLQTEYDLEQARREGRYEAIRRYAA